MHTEKLKEVTLSISKRVIIIIIIIIIFFLVTEHSEKRKSAKQLKTRSNKGILISKSPDRKGSEWNHRGKFSFFLPVPLQVMLGNRFS